MRYAPTGLLVAAMLSVGTGCHRQQMAAPGAADAAPASAVHLVVENDNISDFNVFLVQNNGGRSPVGVVGGGETDSYTLRPTLWSGSTIGVVAMPFGGGGAARTGPLTVSPGDTVMFTITPDVRASFVTVR